MLKSVFISNGYWFLLLSSQLLHFFLFFSYNLDKTIDMLSDAYNLPTRMSTGSPGRAYATRAAQKPTVSPFLLTSSYGNILYGFRRLEKKRTITTCRRN